MKNLGFALSGLGTLFALFAFAYDTAPDGTHNIGLIQNQTMFLTLGAVLFLAGAIIGSIAHGLSRMEAAGLLPPAGSNPVLSAPKPWEGTEEV